VKLLLLGGPRFLGRAIAEAALERGHELTFFNRGRTNTGLYADAEHLVGDRAGDLAALTSREWDAVVDTSGYVPRDVRVSAEALGDSDFYCFVSSVSVYADFARPIDEESPVAQLGDLPDDEITEETYGPLKALCEEAARAVFGDSASIVRPGLIVGPHDPTGRFTYWPHRVARGGMVLAPAPAEEPTQIIDVRDVGDWIVSLCERRVGGVFNAAHPGVSVVVRDRAGAYADGAARGAPDAKQTADRWHLLRNGSEALRTVLEHHHRDLRQAARTAALPMASPAPEDSMVLEPTAVPEPEPRLRTSEWRSRAAQARRDARFAEAARLREQGFSIRAVALTLGVERKTVRRWLRAGHAPTWRHADRGSSILDPHRAWLEERWQAGCRNTAALWRELKRRGFPGQYSTVRAWGTRRRRQDAAVEPAGASRTSRLVKMLEPPTPRRAARLLTSELAKLSKEDRRFVTALRVRSTTIATAADLIGRFTSMVKDKTPAALDSWLHEAEASALATFAAGLRRDEDAVRAALSEPWSNGQVEGQVNRLKVVKREMYGRAGFDLLCKR